MRVWKPIPVFLSGESQGQRSLVGCSPWGHKESDRTEWLTLCEGNSVGDGSGDKSRHTEPLLGVSQEEMEM